MGSVKSGEEQISRIAKEAAGTVLSKPFCAAIDEFEMFLLYEKEGEVYRFLVNTLEKRLIENVLQRTEGNQIQAARIMGINRNTLRSKIRKLKVDVDGFKRNGHYRK